jgi:hypothetical protein
MEQLEDKEDIITYSHLIKRALQISIEFVTLLIILFYLPEIIAVIRFLYRI